MSEIQLCGIDSCTQCYSCLSVCPKQCIAFIEGKEGFFLPHIDREKCIECGLCMKSCHQLTPARAQVTPHKTFAAWTTDAATRTKSSSGGMFSVLANYALSKGGSVYGASMGEDLKVRTIRVDKQKELNKIRGSKYVQSNMQGVNNSVKSDLSSGQFVLFTGTPCQVAGLYAFLKKNYDNLLTVDVVCHGVPSQKAFDIYCERVGLNNPENKEISFRYMEGWGFQMSRHLVAPSKDGDSKYEGTTKTKLITPRRSYYLRAFTEGLMFSETCYSCKYAQPKRVSDFTMADYWGLGTMAPFNHPTAKGVSLLLANTDKAAALMPKLKDLFVEERPLEEAVKGNGNLEHCSGRPAGRDTYFEDAMRMPIGELVKKYNIKETWKDYLRPLKRMLNK